MIRNLLERLKPFLLFDNKDHDLLGIVNDVLSREDYSGFKQLLTPYMHPRGIKEMAASKGLRIAYAAVNLLGSLEMGKARDRIVALSALKDEVMNASVTYLRMNTARVLLQIMKELVRSQDDPQRQLELAHDFRMAATGKARIVTRQLERYHLIRMPEDWSQSAFDHHVHDANTKGRKSATHLIMDAWIKGIRTLTVIYYNFISAEVAEELLQAAQIMNISVRMGIEFQTRFGHKQAKLIWVPRGFVGTRDFLNFLGQQSIVDFMEQGRKLSKIQESQILHVFGEFNANILPDLNDYFDIRMQPLTQEGFSRSMGAGQASMLHLGRYIHAMLLPHLEARLVELQEAWRQADPAEKARIEGLVEEMNALDAESLIEDYLEGMVSQAAQADAQAGSALYCPAHTPASLIETIMDLRVGNRFILNLHGLTCEDVLEILHDCRGRITHLEIVNLKNYSQGDTSEYGRIAALQQAINASSLIPLKRWIMSRLAAMEADTSPQAQALRAALEAILPGLPAFHQQYRNKPLRSSIGSDSTGQSCRSPGMGLVVRQTLPRAARAEAMASGQDLRKSLAVGVTVTPRMTLIPRESTNFWLDAAYRFARGCGPLRSLGYRSLRSFRCKEFFPTPDGDSNLVIMGGVQQGCGNNLLLDVRADERDRRGPDWQYLNSHAKNAAKILAGFIPAFLTFFFSREWWMLKYFEAFIWFAITGLRTIFQSVLGGGGFTRTPLLRWNDYVSWGRMADSLLYTGLSVPLLDYLVKTLLLDRGLGINVSTNPVVLYGVMGLVNGCYISGHNIFRGLPRAAAFGNFFRCILSIPLAVAFSAAIVWVIDQGDTVAASAALQPWASVISKLASDCVAGVIEGLADRGNNMKQRLMDYRAKIDQVLEVQERLEVLFPMDEVPKMLAEPKAFMSRLSRSHKDLENAVIVNSLDFLYFWMYQPRGMSALGRILRELGPQERQVFLASQSVLLRKREISQLFLDGLLGKNFSKGLAFYLDYAGGYLDSLKRLESSVTLSQDKSRPDAGR